MPDELSELYQDLLIGSYDCVDRIVLNGYFRQGHSAGGFRVWWRQLFGSDESLDNTHLMRLAGRFGRRIYGYAQAHKTCHQGSCGGAQTRASRGILGQDQGYTRLIPHFGGTDASSGLFDFPDTRRS